VRQFVLLLLCSLVCATVPAVGRSESVPTGEIPRELSACGDIAEFAPYTYFKRRNGVKTDELTGISVEYLHWLVARTGRTLRILPLPWARCVAMAESGEIDLILDILYTPERQRQFHSIGVINRQVRVGYLYRKADPPPLPAGTPDMVGLNVCGISGYNYEGMGLGRLQIRNWGNQLENAVLMLKARRCDLLPTGEQFLAGERAISNRDYLADPELGFQALEWINQLQIHIGVSRRTAYSEALQTALATAVRQPSGQTELKRLTTQFMTR
jgi:polar amino acid transport system substrate-binding protein